MPDECCNNIIASHVVEHINPARFGFVNCMNEWWRISKPHARLAISMPYGYSRGFLQDPTHCFSDDTEVLTKEGWKLIKDVTKKDIVYVLNEKTLAVSESGVKNVIEEDYNGKMINFKNISLDLLVTPNHDLIWTNSSYKKDFKKVRADKLLKYKNHHVGRGYAIFNYTNNEEKNTFSIDRVIRGGNNASKKLPIEFNSEDFFSFLGWYISEGCIYSKNNNYRIIIYQSKEKNKEKYLEIESLIRRLGFSPKCRYEDISFSSKDLYYFLKQFGENCYTKNIPSFLKQHSKNLLKKLLRTLILGDGSKNGDGFSYATVSKQLADDVHEIALKCGYRAIVRKENRDEKTCIIRNKEYKQKDIYFVGISQSQEIHYPKPVEIDYSGKIVCITTERNEHNILVRRNGKPIWSGNCNPRNEATWAYFDPTHQSRLWLVYQPRPWKILINAWHVDGNMEVLLEKMPQKDVIVNDREVIIDKKWLNVNTQIKNS